MNHTNRDLLVLFNQQLMTPQSIEHEVGLLHEMLFTIETLDNIVPSHEVIDVNKYKILKGKNILTAFFQEREKKPFVFLNCNN